MKRGERRFEVTVDAARDRAWVCRNEPDALTGGRGQPLVQSLDHVRDARRVHRTDDVAQRESVRMRATDDSALLVDRVDVRVQTLVEPIAQKLAYAPLAIVVHDRIRAHVIRNREWVQIKGSRQDVVFFDNEIVHTVHEVDRIRDHESRHRPS